ncbi:hypothetical protein ACFWP5_32510 [Streptomyces sp. NPDC058469]|uniref:hypothetical protein n=1 Tax=Streptomyces sp. NPDC058469 TaxID=3346514 RepID=UPI00365FB9ED
MSQPSPDAKAVVRAAEALTTQVRRIADALTTPVVEGVASGSGDCGCYNLGPREPGHTRCELGHTLPPARETDDGPTTPATTCSAQHHGHASGARDCIRAGQHHGDHIDEQGYHWSDTVAVYPLADSTVKVAHWHPLSKQLAEEKQELAGMVGEFIDAQVQHARAADDDALRSTRRDSLLVLLSRAQRTGLSADEASLLRLHVETEMREADTARAVAAGNKRHVQTLVPALQRAEEDANHNADLVADAVHRAESAERDLRTLRSGLRAAGGDPTQVQNLWAQLRMRNRQWRETKRELRLTRSMLEEEGGDVSVVDEMIDTVAKAEAVARERGAAIERVRAAVKWARHNHPGLVHVHDRLRAALDGPEQPTTERPDIVDQHTDPRIIGNEH